MRFDGHLGTWHHDRGFGFITPSQGGQDIFVRDSALPHGPNRPVVGEALSFEIALDDRGRKHAVQVLRAVPRPNRPQPPDDRPARQGRPAQALRRAMPVLLIMLAGWGYVAVSRWTAERSDGHATATATANPTAVAPENLPASPPPRPLAANPPVPTAAPEAFRCDGRQHCTQMRSCAEATFFLRNCPDTKMDGDHDGIPCEDQLCGGGGSGRHR